ncbi:hypothetical protein [Chryseobacterium sp.]|uniref:hypothetical protein n=1 Tax=Chryseobacterium sp. TaxID=1871047 RepID=UPI00289C812B|nr:hypothetical protein [Chryseobacterium sp.]
MKYLVVLFSALLLVACKKETKTPVDSTSDSTLVLKKDSIIEKPNAGILVEDFPFPSEIKECSCYFARSKADFENEKYIYADDAGTLAYMKIDGKRLALQLISSSDMEVDKVLTKEIENENYKISVKGKKLKAEEALLFDGTLTIEKPDGTKTVIPIYGECGC